MVTYIFPTFRLLNLQNLIKSHCQRKPGGAKRLGSADFLYFFSIKNQADKINFGDINREETGRRAEKRNLSPVLFSVCSLSSPAEPRLARLTEKGLLVASGLSVF